MTEDDDFEDMTEAEFDSAFADAEWTEAAPPPTRTSNPTVVTMISFTGSPGITLGGI